jgi:hypothetical protein
MATVTPLTAAFGLTDVGNARLFVAQYGHRLRYVPERGKWLVWTGARWELDDLGEHVELAKAVLEDAARQAVDKAAVQHFARSMTRRGVEAMIGLAAPTRPSVSRSPSWTPTRPRSARPAASWTCAPASCARPTPASCTPARRRARRRRDAHPALGRSSWPTPTAATPS